MQVDPQVTGIVAKVFDGHLLTRDEIDSTNKGQVSCNSVYGCIIRGLKTDQQIRILRRPERF